MRRPSRAPGPETLPPDLLSILAAARDLGFVGPGELAPQVAHARGFRLTVPAPTRALDLGSGGGVPGLVLALEWPESEWVLLDAMQRRCTFLIQAVRALGLEDRVRVRNERSELAARATELRDSADLVTARGFGVPQLTAESAAGFLRIGGRLVVSEPPDPGVQQDRWPEAPLDELGLRTFATWQVGNTYRVLQKHAPTPDQYPRSPKAQQRSPLWGQPGKRTA